MLSLACLALARLAQVEPELAGALCAPRRRRASRSVVAARASPRDTHLAILPSVQGQVEGAEPMPKTMWHTDFVRLALRRLLSELGALTDSRLLSCLTLPQALDCLGQSATFRPLYAEAGCTGLAFDLQPSVRRSTGSGTETVWYTASR